MSEPTNEFRVWVGGIKEALGLQFSSVHREIKSLDTKVTDGIDLVRELEARVRALELSDARRGSPTAPRQESSDQLSINYKMIGAIISGVMGGLYVLFDLMTKHGGE